MSNQTETQAETHLQLKFWEDNFARQLEDECEKNKNIHLQNAIAADLNERSKGEELLSPRSKREEPDDEIPTPKRESNGAFINELFDNIFKYTNYMNNKYDILERRFNKYKRIVIKQDKQLTELHSLILRLDNKYYNIFNTLKNDIQKAHKKSFQVLNDDLSMIKLDVNKYKKYNDEHIDRLTANIYLCIITILISVVIYQLF